MAPLTKLLLLPLGALALASMDAHAQDSPQLVYAYQRLRELVTMLADNRAALPSHLAVLRNKGLAQWPVPAEFPCAAAAAAPWRRSPQRPTSAHRVRPGDIDVVGAMGDSLTVGFGTSAFMLTQVLLETRGWSFSGGGQGTWREFLTLPNILKEFNPRLTGFAERDAMSHQRASRFNVAEGGAVSADMPLQARNLVKRMRGDPRVDVRNDWKMVTLMIGSNDFCVFSCYEDDLSAAARRHGEDLEYVLDYLQASLPRTIVNLVVTPDLNALINLTHVHPQCYITQRTECACLIGSMHKARRPQVLKTIRLWQQEERRVAASERYRQKEDFAVLLQPFAESLIFPKKGGKSDLTILSEDCFHLSQKGGAMGANGLWANLMEPDGQKITSFPDPLFSFFPCPTEDRPFISTWRNNGGVDSPEIEEDGGNNTLIATEHKKQKNTTIQNY